MVMRKWKVEVWHRKGPRQPDKVPEVRVLVWSEEVEAEHPEVAACRGADSVRLKPEQWRGQNRPPFVVRVYGS